MDTLVVPNRRIADDPYDGMNGAALAALTGSAVASDDGSIVVLDNATGLWSVPLGYTVIWWERGAGKYIAAVMNAADQTYITPGGGGGGGDIAVEDDGTPVVASANTLNFGDNLTVTDDGGGQVTIDATGGGGGGGGDSIIDEVLLGSAAATIDLDLTDAPEHFEVDLFIPHGAQINVGWRINNDSGTNYRESRRGTSGSSTINQSGTTNATNFLSVPASGSIDSSYPILHFAKITVSNDRVYLEGVSHNHGTMAIFGGSWHGTLPITSLRLFSAFGDANFPAGTHAIAHGFGGGGGGGGGDIAVEDDGTPVVAAANTLNFGTGLDVTDDGGGQVTIDAGSAPAAIEVEDSGTPVVASVAVLDFGNNLAVTDNGSGDVTIDAPNPGIDGIDVEDGGTPVASPVTIVNFGTNLAVTDDGGGQVTVDASGGGGGGIDGIDIEDDGTPVASPVTIVNFGDNLSVTDDGGGQVTVDAAGGGGGGGGGLHYGSPLGDFYQVPGFQLDGSGGFFSAGSVNDSLIYFPMLLTEDATLEALQVEFSTSGAGNVMALIYEADEEWLPGALVYASEQISTGSTGRKTFTSGLPTSLPAGRYLLTPWFGSSAAVIRLWQGPVVWWAPTGTGTNLGFRGYSQVAETYDATPPDPGPAPSAFVTGAQMRHSVLVRLS